MKHDTGQLLPFSRSPQERRFLHLVRAHGSPLLVLDTQGLREQYQALAQALPGVDLHYAIKALPHQAVVDTLAAEGAGFDIAGSGELDLLRRAQVSPRDVIHSHPIKPAREISAALRFGCTRFVVDNAAELEKFLHHRHRVGLVLRIAFRNPTAGTDLSHKFGCDLEQVPGLLERARELGLRIVGLSFHVGSQCRDPAAHTAAIQRTLLLIRELRASHAAAIDLLDIGGGFPVDYGQGGADIEAFCAPLRDALAAAPSYLRVIAEPGRVLVAAAVTGVFTVIGKALREERPWYYLDDGIYGSFSGQVFEQASYPMRVFRDGPRRASVLAGPTCDSVDVISEDIALPDLQVGDLVIAGMMGAYTAASATEFNSLPRTPLLVVHDANQTRVLV